VLGVNSVVVGVELMSERHEAAMSSELAVYPWMTAAIQVNLDSYWETAAVGGGGARL
jgi:hypothetical protein